MSVLGDYLGGSRIVSTASFQVPLTDEAMWVLLVNASRKITGG
jgi:hypothetical protein